MNTITLIALLLILILLVYLSLRKGPDLDKLLATRMDQLKASQEQTGSVFRQEIGEQRKELASQLRDSRQDLDHQLTGYNQQQLKVFDLLRGQVNELVSSNEERFGRLTENTTGALEKIRLQVGERLEAIRVDNNEQLERMRSTVDEKLHKTLEERLGRSFKMVSEHLEKVQKGLGEMQSLAAGVGDLKKVLSNVKTRGILGEIQLLNIIEEIMTMEQYDLNAAVVPGSQNRVEVAIKMPGNSGSLESLYIPIDSKFPMDKYQSLTDAYDLGCTQTISEKSKDLRRAIIVAAREIQTKYIYPPHTTDFAIMFLPVEGLYAEVSRQGNLLHILRTEHQILVAGPSNLSAFLSSLQMGFRTLAIEKRSSEVWTMLAEIKTEFGKFGTALEKVQKKLTEANNAIDQAGVRKRALERKLNRVEDVPKAAALPVKSIL